MASEKIEKGTDGNTKVIFPAIFNGKSCNFKMSLHKFVWEPEPIGAMISLCSSPHTSNPNILALNNQRCKLKIKQ
jgi:hypothetical protein